MYNLILIYVNLILSFLFFLLSYNYIWSNPFSCSYQWKKCIGYLFMTLHKNWILLLKNMIKYNNIFKVTTAKCLSITGEIVENNHQV